MILVFNVAILRAHLTAALPFVSTDETRPHLNALQVTRADEGARFASTDGHRLWIASARVQDGALSPEAMTAHAPIASVLLARETVLRMLKTIDRKGPEVMIHTSGEKAIAVHVTQGGSSTVYAAVDATFPPIADCIPTIPEVSAPRPASVACAEYYAEVATALHVLRNAERSPKDHKPAGLQVIEGTDEYAPIVVTSEGVDALALIMPMRSDASKTYRHASAMVQRYTRKAAAPEAFPLDAIPAPEATPEAIADRPSVAETIADHKPIGSGPHVARVCRFCNVRSVPQYKRTCGHASCLSAHLAECKARKVAS